MKKEVSKFLVMAKLLQKTICCWTSKTSGGFKNPRNSIWSRSKAVKVGCTYLIPISSPKAFILLFFVSKCVITVLSWRWLVINQPTNLIFWSVSHIFDIYCNMFHAVSRCHVAKNNLKCKRCHIAKKLEMSHCQK